MLVESMDDVTVIVSQKPAAAGALAMASGYAAGDGHRWSAAGANVLSAGDERPTTKDCR